MIDDKRKLVEDQRASGMSTPPSSWNIQLIFKILSFNKIFFNWAEQIHNTNSLKLV